jgi:hypothetical protein
MAKPVDARLGFSIRIVLRPGVTLTEARQFERAVEDYAQAHGLILEGHQLGFGLQSAERSLTATDQVDVVDWLLDQPSVGQVRLGRLSRRRGAPAGLEDGYIVVQPTDITVIGLTLLYRSQRVSADLYLQILGGFVRPALH